MRLDDPTLRTTHGVYLARDAKTLGIPRDSRGQYPGTRVLPGVMSLLPGPFPAEVKWAAALAYAGRRAKLTGLAAAAVLGWRPFSAHDLVAVQLPSELKAASRSFVLVERTNVHDPGIRRLDLDLASPARILASSATKITGRELTAMITRAVQRHEASGDEVLSLIVQHPHLPGCRKLRLALAALATGAESIKEVDTISALQTMGLPPPLTQIAIYIGGKLIAIADFYYDGVAGFYDGLWHESYEVAQADKVKRTYLEASGLEVVVATKGLPPQVFRARMTEARAQAAGRTGPRRWVARNKAGEEV